MRRGGSRALAGVTLVIVALTSALALGAAWALSAKWLPQAAWPVWVVAVVLALTLHLCSHRRGWGIAALAGAGTLLASLYAECLQLTARIAGQLGLSVPVVIRTSGIDNLCQMALLLLPDARLATCCAAAVLAVVLTLMLNRNRDGSRPAPT